MAVRIPLELSTVLKTDDPIAVWNKWFREATSPTRTLLERTVQRLGVDEYVTTDDDDPKKKHRIALKPTKNAGADELALKFAIVGARVRNGARVLEDEARRMALGQGRGPATRSFDGQDLAPALIDDEAWRAFGTSTAGGVITQMRRSLDADPDAELRHFEPVTMTVVLGIAVPVLIALIPIVLPMVLDAGRRFIENLQATGGDIGKAAQDALAGKSTQTEIDAAAADAAAAAEERRRTLMRIAAGVAAAVIVVGAVVYFRRSAS